MPEDVSLFTRRSSIGPAAAVADRSDLGSRPPEIISDRSPPMSTSAEPTASPGVDRSAVDHGQARGSLIQKLTFPTEVLAPRVSLRSQRQYADEV